jgi:hypothetical protein
MSFFSWLIISGNKKELSQKKIKNNVKNNIKNLIYNEYTGETLER